MNGRGPSNCTSMTAPITWVTRPTILLAIAQLPLSDGFRTGDDLDQFFCDVRLPRPVVVQGQTLDHVARVARCVVHRRHARAMLTRGTFQQRAKYLYGQGLRQQTCQDGLFVRLELISCAAEVNRLAFRWRRGGYQLLFRDDLGDHGAEAIIDQDATID